MPRLDTDNLTQSQLARLFGVKSPSIAEWSDKEPACPRKPDGRYDLNSVLVWYKDFVTARYKTEGTIKDEKTRWEITKLQATVKKIEEQYIERSQHELILVSQASSLRTFLEKSFLNNVHFFANKGADELRVIMYDFVVQMMRAYSGTQKA